MAEGQSFAELLRQYRLEASLSQQELAERAGLSVDAVGRHERGERQRPHAHTVRRYAEALGLSSGQRERLLGAARGTGPPVSASPAGVTRDEGTPAPATAGPWRSLLGTPANEMVGRERELGEILDLLRWPSVRLLTLTGPGGTGKTRLALEVASKLGNSYAGGAGLVELAPLADPGLIAPTIAAAVGMRSSGARPIEDDLAEFLGGKQILLVLDNFEHLIAGRQLVGNLIRACPDLTVLVTSREVLHLSTEHEYPVPPLALPIGEASEIPELLMRYDAVALFVARVRAIRPHFTVTPENAGTVAAICHRLDGLPLAIELAAARIRLFSLSEMLGRLDDRLRLLTGGARDLAPRQRTLRGTIDWSYGLLDEEERRLFARLAVFAGGWTLEAAEAVCGEGSLDVLNSLEALIDKSLIRARETGHGEMRFEMLETIREYALERLEGSGEVRSLRSNHADYYISLCRDVGDRLRGHAIETWIDRLDHELDNLRAAIAWLLDNSGAGTAVDAISRARRFWEPRGHMLEAQQWLREGLATQELDPAVRGRAMTTLGYFHMRTGPMTVARELLEDALTLLQSHGNAQDVAWATNVLAGTVMGMDDDVDYAVQLFDTSRQLYEEIGDHVGAAITIGNLGILERERDRGHAASLLEDAMERFREQGEMLNVMLMKVHLASMALDEADTGRAARLLLETVEWSCAERYLNVLAWSVYELPRLAQLRDELLWMARFDGVSAALQAETGFHPDIAPEQYKHAIESRRADLSPESWDAAWKEGNSVRGDAVGDLTEQYLRSVVTDSGLNEAGMG